MWHMMYSPRPLELFFYSRMQPWEQESCWTTGQVRTPYICKKDCRVSGCFLACSLPINEKNLGSICRQVS